MREAAQFRRAIEGKHRGLARKDTRQTQCGSIDLAERELLDRHEGVGSGYRRDDAFAVEGSAVPTSSYLGTSLDHTLRPFDWYLATVVAGADYHGLETAYVAALRSTRYVEDTELDRRTRVEAIKAMRQHGIEDYRTLLERLG